MTKKLSILTLLFLFLFSISVCSPVYPPKIGKWKLVALATPSTKIMFVYKNLETNKSTHSYATQIFESKESYLLIGGVYNRLELSKKKYNKIFIFDIKIDYGVWNK